MPYFEHQGYQLHYRQQGETGAPLLLFLPGSTASSAPHQGELEYFSPSYCAAALDYLGTGKSARLAVWPDSWWEDNPHQAAALIQHMGYERAVVVGASGGGNVALNTAIAYPHLVHAVVADSTNGIWSAQILKAELAEREKRTPMQVQFWEHSHGEDWEQVVQADSDLMRRLSEGDGDLLKGRLKEITCPVLLTGSLSDRTLPDLGQQAVRMAQQIPECVVFLSNQGDHPLMWTRPLDFRRVCSSFLESVFS